MNDSNARRGSIVLAGCALAFAALSAHSADEEAVAKARAGLAEIGRAPGVVGISAGAVGADGPLRAVGVATASGWIDAITVFAN